MSDLLTIEQVAQRLQVCPRTVRRAIQERGLRASQVAGRGTWRVRAEDLDAWLQERSNTPVPALDVAVLARHAGRPRAHRRTAGGGMLTVTEGMGR